MLVLCVLYHERYTRINSKICAFQLFISNINGAMFQRKPGPGRFVDGITSITHTHTHIKIIFIRSLDSDESTSSALYIIDRQSFWCIRPIRHVASNEYSVRILFHTFDTKNFSVHRIHNWIVCVCGGKSERKRDNAEDRINKEEEIESARKREIERETKRQW